jgi:pilus assembly protein FimV
VSLDEQPADRGNGHKEPSMAFNKSKALESALKYLNQGKVSQAIGEYQQILRHDAKDQATLMTVGDLYARQGDMTHAVEYFERLAQVYLSDGFNSKAIAIYKKIAKLAPAELAPLERLADLYVQQGVLSEARPLFLQIAESHLKANRSQRAVEVLQRLLDVEPENPRVQMRLAELYNVMGQKKEAAQTYIAYAQRVLERGDPDEAQRLTDRALEVDPTNPPALLLKAKSLAAAKKTEEAIKVLSSHPEADAGGDVTHLIVDLEIESGRAANAIDRARKRLATGHANFGQLLKVTNALIEAGQTEEALPLLRELRDPMMEASEQDKFLKSLTNLTQRSTESVEALELLVDFCRHTSDPFRLNAALDQLADAYAKAGNHARAEELLRELAGRNKDDERVQEKLGQLRSRSGESAPPADVAEPPVSVSVPAPVAEVTTPVDLASVSAEPPVIVEEELDEETQRYIAQALTDVDLFSSYGLTQKATHLLENVLQRAPRHTPTLERLLDLYLGAGNERRTAEAAALLEQIHRERNDAIAADHFGELRKRFQKAAGLREEELPKAPPRADASSTAAAPQPQASVQVAPEIILPVEKAPTAEFEVPLAPLEPEAPRAETLGAEAASILAPHSAGSIVPVEPPPGPAGTTEEVDLSDEWEAMAREVAESEESAEAEPSIAPAASEDVAETAAAAPEPSPEPVTVFPEPAAPEAQSVEAHAPAQPGEAEPHAEPVPAILEEAAPDETIEVIEEPVEAVPSSNGDFPPPAPVLRPAEQKVAFTTDDFISELVAEIDADGPPLAETPQVEVEADMSVPPPVSAPVQAVPLAQATLPPAPPPHSPVPELAPQVSAETLNELSDVFQEFRSELGEIDEAEEDLETHYNLGIAYREMGLLDEAIGEFQKVAKAIQKGKPFPYAMNCSTLLALSFMDKGQPKIASLWYRRALDTPGLDHESILALRYDLAVALEAAGDSKSALDSFQQVYAMNIDYRDVSDRISALQKHETHV